MTPRIPENKLRTKPAHTSFAPLVPMTPKSNSRDTLGNRLRQEVLADARTKGFPVKDFMVGLVATHTPEEAVKKLTAVFIADGINPRLAETKAKTTILAVYADNLKKARSAAMRAKT